MPRLGSLTLTKRMLECQIQQGIKLLGWVIIPKLLRRFKRITKGLLSLKKILFNPGSVGIVEARRWEAGAKQRKGLEGKLWAIKEPLCELSVVKRRLEYESSGRDLLLG
ncbi:hypothetical protein IEQ34_001646 [Dendrobium chrysotoxum]|uniref:Uncharacterized protein n=1 Tax=Dendrobium chrysotoxum TaxID=161865 RepID=A0AAV7HRF8_DENCH|nr:hypothetical protein IEQ34_001646 [Dendrobium chrysotoxum]